MISKFNTKKSTKQESSALIEGWSDPNRFNPFGLFILLRKNVYPILLLVRLGILGNSMNFFSSLVWTAISPVLLIVPYTLVVHDLLGKGWSGKTIGRGEHGFILFAGLLVHSFLIDALSRSSSSIIINAGMVRKTSFPRVILPVSYLGISTVPFLLNLAVTIIGSLAFNTVRIEALWLVPLAIIMLSFYLIALSILISSIAPYFRNIVQIVPFIGAFLLFAGPIFYSLDSVPKPWQYLLLLNPSALPIEMLRAALFGGVVPGMGLIFLYGSAGFIILHISTWCFNKIQEGFSDVL